MSEPCPCGSKDDVRQCIICYPAYAAGWRACQEQMARHATEMWLEARGPTHYYAGSVQERIRAAQLAEARAAEADMLQAEHGGESND